MSDARLKPADAWRRFAGTALGAALALLAAYLALAYALDPYDSGRSGLFSAGAVRPQGPRTALAIRGRDPAFTAAIVGNSHVQLIEPAKLSASTGLPFVNLSVPATGPGEQLLVLGWFLRHHPAPTALVIAADEYWCTDDPALPNAKPFPFWLLAERTSDYLRGLMRFSVAQEVVGRIGWLMRRHRKTAPADGWWDYEPDYLRLGYADDPRLVADRETRPPLVPDPHRAGPFPAAAAFARALNGVPAATPVVLVFPPVYAAGLPAPGSARETAERACKARIAEALAGHPLHTVLDWRVDRPEVADARLFFDQTHYRHPLAAEVLRDIAAALARLRANPLGPARD
ncbi:hypothetical protein [Methylobacterium sp. sgz302541]|uniref:hypothetical protein n=1 Tax=unclassified Methylobacterium TaxID=2615210 RepID=UPI003D34323E